MKARKPTRPRSAPVPARAVSGVYGRIREILEAARAAVARTVNTSQVVAYWLVGREMIEGEQQGRQRAGYGEALLWDISQRLTRDFGKGWSVRQLEYCRAFCLAYRGLLGDGDKSNALRSIFPPGLMPNARRPDPSGPTMVDAAGRVAHPPRGGAMESPPWQPGHRSRTEGDHPTLGLILCTDKNDAVVRYLLGPDQSRKIFTSRYKLHLPTEAELARELKRELKELR